MASNDPEEWPNSDFANVMLDVKALKLAIKQSTSTYRRGVRPPRPALSMEDARGRLAESLTMLNNSPLRPVQPLTTYLPLHSIPYVRKLYSQIRKMRTAGVEDGDKELLQIYLQDFVRAIKPDHPLLRRTEDAPEEEEVVDAHACAVNEDVRKRRLAASKPIPEASADIEVSADTELDAVLDSFDDAEENDKRIREERAEKQEEEAHEEQTYDDANAKCPQQ